ncbi:MAG: hypothetical protein N3B10_03330 [Armatimonadetes bacterium]|nr:hypothetical protein [Armatimonadota bacterium]
MANFKSDLRQIIASAMSRGDDKVLLADLHIHLLPGVDDGPTDWEKTNQMLKILAENNVKVVAPTPHVWEQNWQDIEGRHKGLTELMGMAEQYGIKIISAAEVWAIPDLPERWDKVLSLTYAKVGKYLLVEFDFTEMPLYTEWFLFQLRLRGVTPIIAHPERYLWVHGDERNLFRLLANGALLQVSADTLMHTDTPMSKMAWWLLQNGLADFLASDWHNPDSPYPLAFAVQKLKSILSESDLERLVWTVPVKIVLGQNVQPAWHRSPLRPEVQAFISGVEHPTPKRRWWQFLTFWKRKGDGKWRRW